MCDPVTLMTATATVGAITQGIGAYNQSKATKAAYDYQATAAGYSAEDAVKRGQIAEGQQRIKTAGLKSTQRASMAARGLDLTEGSPLNILTDTDVMGDLDARVIRENADREARGFREDARLLRYRADSENPTNAAFSTLLTGAGSVASGWYSMKPKGP